MQEIQIIKASISQIIVSAPTQGYSWTQITGKPEVASTTIRIQDDEEKKEISRLSSEELVKKIGISEVIAARQMSYGQVIVYFAGQESKEKIERQKEWTTKLAATAQVACPMYQVLVHDMPLSFEPQNIENLKLLQQENAVYFQGINLQRATWLKNLLKEENHQDL